jgi:Xaa-Pro aminopeptidase
MTAPAERRRRLASLLSPGDLAVIATGPQRRAPGADSADPWPDFVYLTGIDHPNARLMIDCSAADGRIRERLFLPESSATLWERAISSEEIAAAEVTEVLAASQFAPVLRLQGFGARRLLVFGGGNPFAPDSTEPWLPSLCDRLLPGLAKERLGPILGTLRATKSPAEIEAIHEAASTAAAGLRRAAATLRPGTRGCDLKAEYLHTIHQRGSRGPGCPILTATGRESLALHFHGDREAARAGDGFLIDVTAEMNRWHADLTRFFPVSGTFSPPQRSAYRAIHRTLAHAIRSLRPGRLLPDCEQEALVFLQSELLREGLLLATLVPDPSVPSPAIRQICPHRVFHHIGCEVHDPVPDSLPLPESATLAIEPGALLPALGFGLRLEETVALTTDGATILTSAMPSGPEEIEDLLRF